MEKRNVLYGGLIGPLVFLLNDIIGSLVTDGFSPIVKAVSELTQAGAEHALPLSTMFLIAGAMLAMFGVGLILRHRFDENKKTFVGGCLIMLLGAFSALSGTVLPMDPFGEEASFAGSMHIIITGFNIVFVIMAIPLVGMGMEEERGWRRFKLYSFVTALVMMAFGASTSALMMYDIEMLGPFERVTIYAYQSWIIILAFLLLRDTPGDKTGPIESPTAQWIGDDHDG